MQTGTRDGTRCALCARGIEHTLRAHVESVAETARVWKAIRRQRLDARRLETRASRLLAAGRVGR